MLKVIRIVRRGPGVSQDALVRSLLEGEPAQGLRGWVVSEVVRCLQGDLEADALVEQWWDDERAEAAAADGAGLPGDAWLTREIVLTRPAYDAPGLREGGTGQRAARVKAIGTARKRADFTTEAFFDYWRDVHAPISAKAPGLGGYVVTEVLRRLAGEPDVHAFVSQWWPDEATFLAAGDSPEVAAAWEDVANYAETSGTFWLVREHVQVVPPYDAPGLLER